MFKLRSSLVANLVLGGLAAGTCLAQDQQVVTQQGVAYPEPVVPAGPAVPAPPRVIGEDATPHDHRSGLPPVPVGTGTLPQPNSPETVAPGVNPAAPCDLLFFQNSVVKPSGASTSLVGEPSVAQVHDTALQTGNWYAARSIDSGETWTYISPYTTFAATDGGFCCDQRAVYVPSADITIWLLQYSYSSTTQQGGQRIAVANGRADLQAGTSGSWHSYYFDPLNFGRPAGEWMDYPDIAYSNGFLYCASNIFNSASSYTDSVVWRISLSQLAAGGVVNYSYARSSNSLSGASYRLTQNAGATMYFAEHRSTTTTRAYRWPDSSGTISWTDITVPDWSSTTGYVANGPNGVNWAGRADSRITGAWYRAAANEYGFMWHCGPRSGRAQVYVRTIRISGATNTLISTQDTWSSTLQFMYPAAAVNAAGDIGCCSAIGSSTVNPTTGYFIVDTGCLPNFSGQAVTWFTGNAAPTTASRWGDYFSVQRHPVNSNTFIATGMTCRNGGANSNSEPHYVWFGHEDNSPAFPTVSIQSTPVTGIPITVNVTDRNGNKNGSTNFSRTYAQNQIYVLTAPATFTSGSTVYQFDRWAWEPTAGAGFSLQPIDQRDFEANIGSINDTAQARYLARRTLSIASSNPASGVAITVSVADLNNSQNGSTPFSRVYKDGTTVTVTAPATLGGNPFKQWIWNRVPQPIGQNALAVLANGTEDLTAVYYTHFNGAFTAFCSGCPGTGGNVPAHSGAGTPELGNSISWRIANARPLSGGALYIGASRTNYNGFPLPLNLGFIGMGASCLLCVSVDVSLPFATNSAGAASIPLVIPNDVSLIQGHIYTQPAIVDIGVSTRIPVVHGNALDTLVGGNR
ncbi:MAG: hypothetical protein R3F56_17330 [Planctomycetota bacterium]